MKVSIKYVTFIIFSFTLIACNHSDDNSSEESVSLKDIKISGTWLMSTERQLYKTSTNEYLSSTYISENYIFEDTDKGVKYSRCRNYGRIPLYGIKTDTRFYLNIMDNGFSLNNENVLEQITEYNNEWEPDFHYKSISKLTKITDTTLVDNGTLIVNGPVSLEEYNHICILAVSYSLGHSKIFEIMTPFDDDYISLRLDTYDKVTPGVFEYEERHQESLVKIDLHSNAQKYWNIVGSNTLAPSNATINLIEYSDTKISGSYSFTGLDNESYSGEFDIILNKQ
ncbi:MAG: hypothetical protein OEY52_11950 [Gammaproteobacteria bacterium]|nr:hypothetical protein [Gammaproteobacteria bacterium]